MNNEWFSRAQRAYGAGLLIGFLIGLVVGYRLID